MQDFETESVSTVQDAEASAHEKARLQLTNDLNQLLRRLKSYDTEGAWIAAVNEGASRFASESGLFTINAESLRLRGAKRLTFARRFFYGDLCRCCFWSGHGIEGPGGGLAQRFGSRREAQ